MKKNEKIIPSDLFYSELPQQTNHNDFPRDVRITHAYDKPRNPVLSHDQLLIMANELLREAKQSQQKSGQVSDSQGQA